MNMKKTKAVYKRADNLAGYVLLAPWLLGFIGMWLIPAIISMYYSFTDFNLLNTPKIIALPIMRGHLHRTIHSCRL